MPDRSGLYEAAQESRGAGSRDENRLGAGGQRTLRNSLARAAARLRNGGAAVFPTDTVTGLGCAARNPAGIAAIFRLKRRSRLKTLILFVRDSAHARKFARAVPARAARLLSLCWPGPLTAVLPARKGLPAGLTRGGTVAIRVPAHPAARALVFLAGGALATTSANISGAQPAPDAARAARKWRGSVAVVPGRSGNVPSTVADFTRWPPRVLREGALSGRALRELARICSRK